MMEALFEERQYLGYNKFSIVRRTIIALFCFSVYFFSEEQSFDGLVSDKMGNLQGDTAQIFFLMGTVILVISVLLIFVLHIKTQVFNSSVVIDGLWTARRVKIDLNSIESAEKIRYSKYLLNRPVYNLHRKGKIRFFTMGKEAVALKDRDGLVYILGSQKADDLLRIIRQVLQKTEGQSK